MGDEPASGDRSGDTAPADLAGAAAEERGARLAALARLRESGIDPYPVRFDRDATAAEIRERHSGLDVGVETEERVSVAGRAMLVRAQGKLVFVTLRDGSGTIQLFVSRGVVGDEAFERFAEMDRGDWIGASGVVMTTKRGELSVKVDDFTLLAKALRPLPEKWHGLADVDTRYRQRYVDLIANDEARRIFEIRSHVVRAMRDFLHERGFTEVETPVLHPIPGGATARPFVTHYNALETDVYLRIAPELYLKRLVVGGMEKVFEIGRVFRNEGLGYRWNPEFTMLELYEAFADYGDMMELTEQLVEHTAKTVLGTSVVEFEGHTLDLAAPWSRRSLLDLIREHGGVEVHPSMPAESLAAIADGLGVTQEAGWSSGKLILEMYEKTAEPQIVAPTFVLDYPRDVSPLARSHRADETLVERFELVVAGREIANAFSELTDPIEQRRRFEEQAQLKAMGDVEAHAVDHDYVRALEFGLPPTGGMGLGIDRLVMLLTGAHAIREVLLFPHLRPEVSG